MENEQSRSGFSEHGAFQLQSEQSEHPLNQSEGGPLLTPPAFQLQSGALDESEDGFSEQEAGPTQTKQASGSVIQRKPGDADLDLADQQKKMAENPTLWADPATHAHVGRLNMKSVRKVNRVAGLIKSKFADMPEAVEAARRIDQCVITAVAPNLVGLHYQALDHRGLEYNRLLVQAMHWMAPGAAEIPPLRALIEQQVAAVEGGNAKVIAHRGDGATFDKMGRYAERAGFDKLYPHHNENSPESTDKFLKWFNKDDTSLSGIECDIFMNQDGVPYVTHTSQIEGLIDQESGKAQADWGGGTIQNTPAAAMPGRILSLWDWLNRIDQFVAQADLDREAEGRPKLSGRAGRLRIEIEMKEGRFGDPADLTAWQLPKTIVSKFLKASPRSSFFEVAMFNNSDAPVAMHQASQGKTQMSQVTFGKGGDPAHAEALPEIRFGMHQRGVLAHIDSGSLDGKVVTFAPGLDHPGGDKLGQQLEPVGWTTTEMDTTIEQSIQSARLNIYKTAIDARGTVRSLHVLTDHGNKGAHNILAGGLQVGSPDPGTLAGWDPARVVGHYAAVVAIPPERLTAIVREALAAGNTKAIGETLLREFPALV
jgi:glycerophosphoryl diester phosphodiesterase